MCSVAHARVAERADTPARGGDLAWFRQEFYLSLTARADALFEWTDAVLCADGPVRSLVELTPVAEHRRGHGAMYDALNHGRVEPERLRRSVSSLPLPRAVDGAGRARGRCQPLAAFGRADQRTAAVCHVYRRGKGQAQLIPGWPYSFVAALEPGRTSWTALLDAVRLGPTDDATAVTAGQLREVVDRLRVVGHWRPGEKDIWIVLDSGYDVTRLAFLLADPPIEVVGRLRSDRVLRLPKPPRPPATWPAPQHTTSTDTARYGTAVAASGDRVPPRLTHRGCWIDHHGELPVIEGTLIRLQVAHLPGDRAPKPLWLWTSNPTAAGLEIDRAWQAFLRRFDLDHTFRFLKQTLGWTAPKLRDPPPRTAGPGWSSPRTPSFAWPVT